MLPKGHRIRKSKEFDLIRAEGAKHKSKSFMLVVRRVKESEKNPEYTYPRFGFIVSKKIGKAVVRNKVKRKLREIVRLNLEKLPKDIDCTIIAFEGVDKAEYAELEKEFNEIIEKI